MFWKRGESSGKDGELLEKKKEVLGWRQGGSRRPFWGGPRRFAAPALPRTHGDLLSGLYHQILLSLQKVLADPVRPLCSHYGAVVGLHALGWKAVERVLYPHLPTYWANLQAVLDDYSVSNAQVKADGHKVYGAILVAVERLLKMKAQQEPAGGAGAPQEGSPRHSPKPDPPSEPGFGLGRPLLQLGGGGPPSASAPVPPALSLHEMYRELYDFFGDSLAARFGTGLPPATLPLPATPEGSRKEPPPFGTEGATRKMPQLTANATVSPREEESPRGAEPPPGRPALHRPTSLARPRGTPRQPGHRPGAREIFQKCRFAPRGAPRFSFVIAGRQAGRRCQGRLFQTNFPQHHGPGHVSRYTQKLPMIGRTTRPARRWPRAEYSLHLLL
ncbi:TAF6-like RNA polymerase II p300/CBP-associated factor-associated factor 65 kDa subunit 6L [Athene noctua]|uniref:TAF6-like RNA polymerase II p300/CBP-associated factor-associated factor 65 kDa subunit 6L n=1 Tax=Athene noctua TaxID=126797 RepID=UPI003EB7CB0D